jgi:hypothetical protein
MAFTGNFSCNVFKTGLMNGTFNFTSGTFKIALYTNAATLNASTTAYTSTGEVVASGYTAGGLALTIAQTPTVGTGSTAYISFNNAVWTSALTARGALIYQSGGGNPAVCVLDFGADKTSNTTFMVQFPAISNTSAIIRIA